MLGPGHWWPVVLLPLYGLASLVPATRESAGRLGLVTVWQMIRALVAAVENPSQRIRVLEVTEIRAGFLDGPPWWTYGGTHEEAETIPPKE